jgi:hypothetical protein
MPCDVKSVQIKYKKSIDLIVLVKRVNYLVFKTLSSLVLNPSYKLTNTSTDFNMIFELFLKWAPCGGIATIAGPSLGGSFIIYRQGVLVRNWGT